MSLSPAPDAALTSSIRALPLTAWAARLRGGRVVLQGRLADDLRLGDACVMAGPVVLSLTFTGGAKAAVGSVRVDGEVRAGGMSGSTLALDAQGGWLGPHRVEVGAPLPRALEAIVDAIHDVVVDAEASPISEVSLRFPAGVELVVPGDGPLVLSGAAEGPPEALVLAEPLVVAIGGSGLQVTHKQLRWLANAVALSVSRAVLQPDGRVELEGNAARGLGRIAQGGLDVAGDQLTELVWAAPQFERVRGFLRPLPES